MKIYYILIQLPFESLITENIQSHTVVQIPVIVISSYNHQAHLIYISKPVSNGIKFLYSCLNKRNL